MSVRKSSVLVSIVVMLLACPTSASARSLWDILGYIHELSGPGPFNGYMITGEVFCLSGASTKSFRPCMPDRRDVRLYVTLERGEWDDNPNPRFTGNTDLDTFQAIVYVPLQNAVRSGRPVLLWLDAGVGLGLYRFSDTAVQDPPLWRVSIPFRLRFTPSEAFASKLQDRPRLRTALRAFTYHVGFDYLPEGFSNRSFNGPADFSTDSDVLRTNALTFDVLVFVQALRMRN